MQKENGRVLPSIERLHSLGFRASQFLLVGSRLDKPARVREFITKNKLECFSHIPFTYNFAKTIDEDPWWITNTKKELLYANTLGFKGCVIHVGKAVKLDRNVALENMYNAFKQVLAYMSDAELSVQILIETAAGQGTELAVSLNELAEFYNRFTDHEKQFLGICIDTAHIWGAGADLSTAESTRQYIEEFDTLIGIDHCKLVHFNNSKVKCGAKVDRHENLKSGLIPYEGLATFAREMHRRQIPLVLETPNGPFDLEDTGQMIGIQCAFNPLDFYSGL